MSEETFVVVYKWMNSIEVNVIVEDKKTKEKKSTVRKLTHLEKEVYAVVYGFSKDNQGTYNGSCQYIADIIGTTRITVVNVLKLLTLNNLLLKKSVYENNNKFCVYRAVKPVMSDNTTSNEPIQQGVMSGYTPSNEPLHNNINNINSVKKEFDNSFAEIEKHFLETYNNLFEQNKVINEKPIINYGQLKKNIKPLIKSVGVEKIKKAIDNACFDNWTVTQGFSLTTIISASQINKHLNYTGVTASPKQNNWLEKERAANDSGVW